VGGLGCPAALYLAASGIGHLTLVDGDKVDLTNLQRQILYRKASVGRAKVAAAREALNDVNGEVEVVALEQRIADFGELVAGADVVLDCTDNFATRHALNRACWKARKPLVSGAAMRFDAQVTVFDFRRPDSPCYSCLFPEEAQFEEVQCSTMGVLAPLTGVGEALSGRLMVIDAKSSEWRTMKVSKDPACRVCGKP
jgi:molybdopterin/thiamine biosynthesis adenylyltransferase